MFFPSYIYSNMQQTNLNNRLKGRKDVNELEDLGDPLTVEEKDEVNSSALHWYVSPAHRELCLPCT